MASPRRTKNFANDPQTPMFLYTILKQLDLRSINWNEVAEALSISNGHAARMRYSRMKSQFEGLSNQPKPPKAKKENAGESKPSKSKAKNNKRLLMEEENERLANHRQTFQHAMQQDPDPKKIKVEPQSYMNPWNSSGMYTGQPYPSPYWTQPPIKVESSPFGNPGLPPQNLSSTPTIKREPELSAAICDDLSTVARTIKQEPTDMISDCELSDPNAAIVKQEPGTAPSGQAARTTTLDGDFPCGSYPLSRTIKTYFDRQVSASIPPQPGSSFESAPTYATSLGFPHGSYLSFNDQNRGQNTCSWPPPVAGQGSGTALINNLYDTMMLNPYAVTYQDMLNMPLHRRSPSVIAMPTPIPNDQHFEGQTNTHETQPIARERPEPNDDLITAAPTQQEQTSASNTTNASTKTWTETSPTRPDTSTPTATPARVLHNTESSSEQPVAMADVIEVESDAEVDVDARENTAVADGGVSVDGAGPAIKMEIVEL